MPLYIWVPDWAAVAGDAEPVSYEKLEIPAQGEPGYVTPGQRLAAEPGISRTQAIAREQLAEEYTAALRLVLDRIEARPAEPDGPEAGG